jgi:hypothetical protein
MRRDLAGYFAWKQVLLGFLSLASRLVKTRCRIVHVTSSWRLRQDQVEDRRVDAASDPATLTSPFSIY